MAALYRTYRAVTRAVSREVRLEIIVRCRDAGMVSWIADVPFIH